jgi:hypothetical protein
VTPVGSLISPHTTGNGVRGQVKGLVWAPTETGVTTSWRSTLLT